MNESRAKAIQTRLDRLSETFFTDNGRYPTVEELNTLYKAELAAAQKKSRETYKGTGGFAGMDKEKVKELSQRGVKARKEARKSKEI